MQAVVAKFGRRGVIVQFVLALAMLSLQSERAISETPDGLTRSYGDYIVPPVGLVRADGRTVLLANLLDGSRPVVLEFFYTTCTTICGMQSSTLALARKGLPKNTVFVSISIDPEFDTPARLTSYAKNFPVGPNWYVMTGRLGDIKKVQTAFNARPFGDNKMQHRSLIFIHTAKGRQWLRLEGMANSDKIVKAVRQLTANPPPKSLVARSR